MTVQVSQNVVDTQPVAEVIPPLNIYKFLPFFLLSTFVPLFVVVVAFFLFLLLVLGI